MTPSNKASTALMLQLLAFFTAATPSSPLLPVLLVLLLQAVSFAVTSFPKHCLASLARPVSKLFALTCWSMAHLRFARGDVEVVEELCHAELLAAAAVASTSAAGEDGCNWQLRWKLSDVVPVPASLWKMLQVD